MHWYTILWTTSLCTSHLVESVRVLSLGIFLSALFLLTACSSDDDTELIDELEKELGKDVGNLSNLLTPLYNPEDISWGGAPHYE